jgi:DnaJ domain
MSVDSDYELFGLAPGSSADELKRAYRDLVKIWHPDRFGGNPQRQRKAQEKLKQVNLAYERLQSYLASAASTASANTRAGKTPPTPRPAADPATVRSRPDDWPGSVGERIRASRPAWFLLAGLLAVVLVSSLPAERPRTPESGGDGATPASKPEPASKPKPAPKPEMKPEVPELPPRPTPEPRPSRGVEVKPAPDSEPLTIQQPDCPGPGVHRMIANDGAVLFVNCPPAERSEGP